MADAGYQVVLLSQRPSTNHGASPKSGPNVFKAGGQVHHEFGYHPQKVRGAKSKKKVMSFLVKNKKFISDLTSLRRALEQRDQDEFEEKAERHRQFQEKLQQVRDEIRQQPTQPIAEKPVKAPPANVTPHKLDEMVERLNLSATSKASKEAAKAKKYMEGKKSKKVKPAWATTEKEQENQAEQLANFAQSLDFDAYIKDMEIRQNLESIRNRVESLKARMLEANAASEAAAAAAAHAPEAPPESPLQDKRRPTDDHAPEVTADPTREQSRREAQDNLRELARISESRGSVRSSACGSEAGDDVRSPSRAKSHTLKSIGEDQEERDEEKDKNKDAVSRTVSRALREAPAIRAIHSSASLRAVIKQQQANNSQNAAA